MLDIKQDYFIDNTITYFQQNYFNKIRKLSPEEIKKLNFESDFITLMPDDILCSDEDLQKVRQTKDYTNEPHMQSFDVILDRPFIEVILLSIYFSKNTKLDKQLVKLL